MKILFNNLHPVRQILGQEIYAATQRVIESGWYILGPEVERFEAAFADYCGTKFAIGVANGTDALELALRAADIGPGDEVITVAHTAVATVCGIERSGAKAVLVDIDPLTYTMDPAACAAAITPRTKAIVPVHLYGQPANLTAFKRLTDQHGLLLLEDCAQAHGARYGQQRVGSIGQLGAFSFYPTKNLGAYGDGGAIVTSDPELAAKLKRLRFYGQAQRYQSIERGVNSRLDELQAAILSVKLLYLDEHNQNRRHIAAFYDRQLAHETPRLTKASKTATEHVYHLYAVCHPRRDWLRDSLLAAGVETQIHYPIPVHLQPGYLDLGYAAGSLPVTERVAKTVLSLPCYPGLTELEMHRVAKEWNRLIEGVAHAAAA